MKCCECGKKMPEEGKKELIELIKKAPNKPDELTVEYILLHLEWTCAECENNE